MLVIDHQGTFYRYWNIFHVLCCLSSSYIYGYNAAFKATTRDIEIWIYEGIFVFAIIIEFFVDYIKPGTGANGVRVTDHFLIAKRYFYKGFLYDLFPCIPFYMLPMEHAHMLYMVKVIRLIIGLKLLDVAAIMKYYKKFSMNRLQRIIDKDPNMAENIEIDQTHITYILVTNLTLKTIKLLITILTFCYFTGIIWVIICNVNYHYYDGIETY